VFGRFEAEHPNALWTGDALCRTLIWGNDLEFVCLRR
jgi:hypothetical protein